MSSMRDEMKNGRSSTHLLLNMFCLAIFAWLAYRAYYDLFVFEPGVHYPRVALSQNTWGDAVVQFTLNVPTTTGFIKLGAALGGVVTAVLLFVSTRRHTAPKVRVYWLLLALICLIYVAATLLAWSDFMQTAFDGVG